MSRCIGVLGNVEYPGLPRLVVELLAAADSLGFDLLFDREIRVSLLAPGDAGGLEEGWGSLDCLLTLGGDGTLLRGARLAGPRGVPVLGCNLGRLGFLTMASREELEGALGCLARGEFEEEQRLALRVNVERRSAGERAPGAAENRESASEEEKGSFYAINDAVIHKSGFARLIKLRVWADDEEVGQYSADGIILSTATGSTAYSLSAGGPILTPTMDALVATPISPHTLAVRPVVLPGNTRLRVQVASEEEEVILTVDGQSGIELGAGDHVAVSRSEHPVRLLRLPGYSFFSVLRRKLRWGDVRPAD
ncbi:MAG: NAD(+)/NADH kinase [Gemmatimonadota bacterium]